MTTELMKKLEKSLSTLKRNVKIESGTYVSKEQLERYKRVLQKDLGDIVVATVGHGYDIRIGNTKTKQNGTTRLDIRIGKTDAEMDELIDPELKAWRDLIDRCKRALEVWLDLNNFKSIKIYFSQDRGYKGGVSTVVVGVGWFEVRVETKQIIEKYKT